MLTPFAPFFVLFCHVVETLSAGDLRLLQDFVASLEPLRDASETVEKLYRVFQVYRDVAIVYVDAKSRQQGDQNMGPINDEFDMYLSQLGFMPVDDQAASAASSAGRSASGEALPVGGGGGGGGGQAAQMAGWFSGSRDMFGLLEEDLSNIESNRWMMAPGSSM